MSGVKQFTVNIAAERRPGLQLRGDILIKCYHRGPSDRETIFACQFHTCAVADYTLSFTRQELDGACNGKILFCLESLLGFSTNLFVVRASALNINHDQIFNLIQYVIIKDNLGKRDKRVHFYNIYVFFILIKSNFLIFQIHVSHRTVRWNCIFLQDPKAAFLHQPLHPPCP